MGFVRAMLEKIRDDVLPSKGVTFDWGRRGASNYAGDHNFRPNVFAMGFSTGGLFSYSAEWEL